MAKNFAEVQTLTYVSTALSRLPIRFHVGTLLNFRFFINVGEAMISHGLGIMYF